MAKGLKMFSAKIKETEEPAVNISKLSKSHNGRLHCSHCNADVEYVSGYLRDASKKPVAAYLRLCKNEEHKSDCKNSVKGSIEQLVDESNAIEDIPSIFEIQDDGSYVFRMNLLVEAQKILKDTSIPGENDNREKGISTGSDYARTGNRINSYFRSASGIAKLRALIEDSADIELFKSLIKIQYKNKYIKWNDFYYDESRYDILYRRAAKAKLHHPVAINVTVKSDLGYYAGAKVFHWSYRCFTMRVDDDDKRQVFVPKIQFSDEKIANQITKLSTYLVVGDVWANSQADSSVPYRNFNISIFNRCQIKHEVH